MKKYEAQIWYAYMYDGDMTNFDTYYSTYKQWFDGNQLDKDYWRKGLQSLASKENNMDTLNLATGAGGVMAYNGAAVGLPDIYVNNNTKQAYDVKVNLAPITTCTNTYRPVPCQEKGNNPMQYVETGYVQYGASGCAPTPKNQTNQPVATAAIQVVASADTAEEQRKYLRNRIDGMKYEKYNEIARQFHRDEPDGPKTIKELKERLKKGLYTIITPKNYDEDESDYEDGEGCGGIYWRDYFSWRTDDTKFDKEGYNAAYKELADFIQDCIDQIRILDPKDGLKVLDDLKKWKPSKSKK